MGWRFRVVLGGTRFGETVKGGGGACGTVCGEAPCEWRVMKYRQQACALGRRFWGNVRGHVLWRSREGMR
ncbi:hypothetical protein [Bartonella rattaustraliani]|uniref:hypothetical protein n=1 Tax=Bartonella rattaustraliani TaxID=481139 RepID=UPI0012EA2CA7|nr:hypothetical protein [Bartonella rattaustraliani]